MQSPNIIEQTEEAAHCYTSIYRGAESFTRTLFIIAFFRSGVTVIAISFIDGAILTSPDCSSMGQHFVSNMTGKLPYVSLMGDEVLTKMTYRCALEGLAGIDFVLKDGICSSTGSLKRLHYIDSDDPTEIAKSVVEITDLLGSNNNFKYYGCSEKTNTYHEVICYFQVV